MKKGFSLVEFIVVISIITILSAIIIPIYQGSKKQLSIQRSANKLAQDIRRAQEMAMAAKECDICGGIIPSGGYGIYFETTDWPTINEYTAYLYADTSISAQERYDSGDQIIETISLGKEIKIKMVEDTAVSSNRKKFSINFKPPDPIVDLVKWDPGSDNPLHGDLLITISLKEDENKTKTIRINKAGLIYAE